MHSPENVSLMHRRAAMEKKLLEGLERFSFKTRVGFVAINKYSSHAAAGFGNVLQLRHDLPCSV
jgi:hypothetical protein